MRSGFAAFVLIATFGTAVAAPSPGAPAAPANNGGAKSAQAQASLADQLESCRQHVVQMNEAVNVQQKKLAALRTERKTISVSGGEVARFKLANIDQEIRDLSKQSQATITQIDAEDKRCDSLQAKLSGGGRAAPSTPPAPPARQAPSDRRKH
jgi:hypothetical protein